MDISDIGGEVICYITGLTKCPKLSGPNKMNAYAEDKLLCPVACIKKYLYIWAGLVDGKCTKFFITHGTPHHPLSKDTLSRWVKDVMVCAGTDATTFKLHRSRGGSTSKNFHLGSSLSGILKQNQLSNAKTFQVFIAEKLNKMMARKHEEL